MSSACLSLTVTLSLGSQPIQVAVAEGLQRRGGLRRILVFSAKVEVFDPDGVEALKLVRSYRRFKFVNRLIWAAWKRIPGSGRVWNMPLVATTAYADRLASQWVPPSTIFHGWTGNSLACIKRARQQGSIILIEHVSMHPREWKETVFAECRRFDVQPGDCRAILPDPLMRRMEREFEMADAILVPSELARRSFERAGLGGRTIVVHAGVDHHFFAPPSEAAPREVFRVCFAGRVELPKGIPYLLQAWNQLRLEQAELVLIGEVAPEIHQFIRRWALPNVRLLGSLPQTELAKWYRASHLFAFPSVNEGLARVLLEAMSCDLPVVATDLSGAEDCITTGVEGHVVTARNTTALAEAILWHYKNQEASGAMGKAARSRIQREFTLPHYVERVVGIYLAQVDKSKAVQFVAD
jgi:glycosyltransferase involved in cell wall biosynthesis